ncbi:MAG: ABC transporter permease [Deltaproteobacteria bacterium]|jgi:D-methionine transport system permease protein|nr:ABC transporter permease [Deltaproteobacteria bacterium]
MILTPIKWTMIQTAALQSLYMVSLSTILTSLAGIPLGVLLVITRQRHIFESAKLNFILGLIINATRSIPFPIFIVFVIPFTRFIVGTSIGPTAVIVPLTLAAVVFMARLTETSLLEVPFGVIEAAQAAGATRWQIIIHVLVAEARPGLIMAITITTITLICYSAMAGAVGGGGLGDLAIRYGYQRYQTDIMWVTVILLLLVVQGVQNLGDWLVRRISHR